MHSDGNAPNSWGITGWRGDTVLTLPDDDVELLVLIGQVKELGQLETYRRAVWVQCTPLYLRYQDRFLSELSSSELDDDTLARGISIIVGRKLSPREILELDFGYNNPLSDEQQYLIGLMLDEVGQSYLEYV